NQQVTFLTDGGADVRELPLYLNPQAEHLIDWFHITMRLTVLGQIAKGLDPKLARTAASELERLKWFLWHGNAFRALQVIDDLKIDLDAEDPTPQERKLYKTLAEFGHYIDANTARIPNYGERYRCGEAISNAFVESAVNQIISKRMVKKQQMRWSPRGAHLLLQIRTQVINEDLHNTFRRWYPGLMPAIDEQPLAA
ncbi:MAG: ISKra4 family transposase, partial [Solirubrobacteraceae bacterium]